MGLCTDVSCTLSSARLQYARYPGRQTSIALVMDACAGLLTAILKFRLWHQKALLLSKEPSPLPTLRLLQGTNLLQHPGELLIQILQIRKSSNAGCPNKHTRNLDRNSDTDQSVKRATTGSLKEQSRERTCRESRLHDTETMIYKISLFFPHPCWSLFSKPCISFLHSMQAQPLSLQPGTITELSARSLPAQITP